MPMADPGTYAGNLTDWATKQADSGTDYVALTFRITHIAVNGQWEAFDTPFERDVRCFLSDRAFPYSAQKLQTLEFNGDFGEGMDFGDAPKYEGVRLNCEHQAGQDRTYENWDLLDWGNGGGGDQNQKAPQDRIRLLNQKFKQAGSTPTAAAAPQSAAEKAADDGDVPF